MHHSEGEQKPRVCTAQLGRWPKVRSTHCGRSGNPAKRQAVSADVLVILLNGPLGVGKSTLGEVLGDSIDGSVTLDGDGLLALNPPPADEVASLHETVALLVGHHLAQGYRRFILNHYWSSPGKIAALKARLDRVAPKVELHCFRLTLEKQENVRRIMLRRGATAIDEAEFEDRHFAREYDHLTHAGDALGIPFDASDPPDILAARLREMIGLAGRG